MNEENLNKLKLIIKRQIKICYILETVYGEADEKTTLAFEVLNNLYKIKFKAEGRCQI